MNLNYITKIDTNSCDTGYAIQYDKIWIHLVLGLNLKFNSQKYTNYIISYIQSDIQKDTIILKDL